MLPNPRGRCPSNAGPHSWSSRRRRVHPRAPLRKQANCPVNRPKSQHCNFRCPHAVPHDTSKSQFVRTPPPRVVCDGLSHRRMLPPQGPHRRMCVRAASAPDHRAAASAARQCGRSTPPAGISIRHENFSGPAGPVRPAASHRGEQPWQRASGRSSRTTVVAHACTASVPVCAPVQVAQSSRRVAVRAAPS